MIHARLTLCPLRNSTINPPLLEKRVRPENLII
jgi:hypothetical protein